MMKKIDAEFLAAAKSITELALEHDLIEQGEDTESTAKEIALFYNTFLNEITNNIL